MALYTIGTETIDSRDPYFAQALAVAYANKLRPACLCNTPSPPMYIALINQTHVIKRMPHSGIAHAPACDSHDPGSDLSGFGAVNGSAIEHHPDNSVTLHLGFALSKNAAQNVQGEASEKISVKGSTKRLSLRATLHYLWQEAGLNVWTPACIGKRTWFQVQQGLLKAAAGKEAKKSSLSSLLYVPEFFDSERKAEIRHRRNAHIAPFAQSNGRKLMLLVAEISRIDKTKHASTLVAKHLPDFPFKMDATLSKSFDRTFSKVTGLWEFIPNSHLVAIATVTITSIGIPEVQELAVMLTNSAWVPIEHSFDAQIVDDLMEQKRSFNKPLRFNLLKDQPVASAILLDVKPDEPNALFISLSEMDKDAPSAAAIDELAAITGCSTWVWNPASGEPPSYPPATRQTAAGQTATAAV